MMQRGLPEGIGVLVLIAFWFTEGPLHLALGLMVVAALGVIIAANHPRFVRDALALSLGLVPAGDLGGMPLALMGLAGLFVIALRDRQRRVLTSIELWTIGLLVTCLFSVILVRISLVADIVQYAKWAIPTLIPLLLINLPIADLIRFGRLYAYGAGVGAAIGSLVATVDSGGLLMKPFKLLGYHTVVVQYAYTTGAPVKRLAATYLNPNAAGIFLMIGLVFALAFLRGRQRVLFTLVIAAGVGLSFSRSAIGGLVIAALVMLLFHPMDFDRRFRAAGGIALAGVGALMVPPIRHRLLDSFGSSDAGTTDRAAALKQLPGQLHDHWLFGLGWGRPEFVSEAATAQVNFVANSPLLTVYRGGVFAGFCFTMLLIVGIRISWRALRGSSWAGACIGAGFIGFALVTLQLDFPVVTAYPLTAIFGIFLVMVKRAPEMDAYEASLEATPSAASASR